MTRTEEASLKSSGFTVPLDGELEFVCNICGAANRKPSNAFAREAHSCEGCGSTVRWRSIIHALSRELFGISLALDRFPTLKGIRGLGMSDWDGYAAVLAEKFDYKNTFYDHEPQLDIADPPAREDGLYDFIISSEVFEHVAPPVERAFASARRLLKPNGVLVLTVPYTFERSTTEHYPDLHEYTLAEVAGRQVLVNRTRSGELQVFDDLVFHGSGGATVEIRRFSEQGLRGALEHAGFRGVQFYGENYAPFGIIHLLNRSLPLVARKEPFALGRPCVAEILEQMRDGQQELEDARKRLKHLGRRVIEKEDEVKERSEWALRLERELQQRTEWALSLQSELKQVRLHMDWLTGAAWTRVGRFLRFLSWRSTKLQ